MRFIALLFFVFLLSGFSISWADLKPVPWQTFESKTQCGLWQQAGANYLIGFNQRSGEPNEFYLLFPSAGARISKASVLVTPAPWRHELTYSGDYPVYLENSPQPRLLVYADVADTMAAALSQGQYPAFEFVMDAQKYHVPASAMKFAEPFKRFNDCRKRMLPFGMRQLQQGRWYFAQGSKALSHDMQSRLQKIASYFLAIKSAHVTVRSATAIAGKADDKWFNARASLLRDNLVSLGVGAGRIRIDKSAPEAGSKDQLVLTIFGPDALRTIHYRKGNTSLNNLEKRRLDVLADYANAFQQAGNIRIDSHTDSKGSRKSNLKVSQLRGDTIREYLIGRGVAAERIAVKAYGESRPIKSNRFPPGRAQNRRAVIIFTH